MMRLLHNNRRWLTMLAAMVFLALPLSLLTAGAEPQEQPPPGEVPAASAEPSSPENLPLLRQRYHQDATGVRARLGMCRRGHGGEHGPGHAQGMGMGEGHGAMRGQHHRCPREAQQEDKP